MTPRSGKAISTNRGRERNGSNHLRQPAQTMSRNKPQKDHASNNTATAMELNTRTHQPSAKSCKQIENGSHRLCATQRIANLLREAANRNLYHHKDEGWGRSSTQSQLLPHLNHEYSSIALARCLQEAACQQRPITPTMVQRSTPTSTPSTPLNRTPMSHQRGS